MNTTPQTFPLVTAPVGNWPLRCIYTHLPVTAGQLVALGPLGYISLAPLRRIAVAHQTDGQQQAANEVAYLIAVFQEYEQRQGWLPQAGSVLTQLAENLLAALLQTVPPGQTRYLHQLLQATDLKPWLNALNALPANPE
jgi:hypothetical protein